MKITITSTSQRLTDILSQAQLERVLKRIGSFTVYELSVEIGKNDTLYWTTVDDEAVVGECRSITSEDIEGIKMRTAKLSDIKMVSDKTIDIIIDIV